MTTQDYPDHPFSSQNATNRTLMMESFHTAIASLRCFDSTKNKDNKKPHFDFFDRDNSFIAGARHAPAYNGPVFFLLWLKAVSYLGEFGKEIAEASTAAEIQALRTMAVKVVRYTDGEYVTESAPLISTELRAIVDNILFMSVYGHKTLFEQRVSPQRRAAFQKMAHDVAENNEDEFYEAWINYRALNPAKRQEDQKSADSETERMMKAVLGSDDEDPGPAGPARPPVRAPAPAPAPAPAAAAAAAQKDD